MTLNTVRVFTIAKLPWIKHQQKKLHEQERESPREFIDRESHFVWGRRYLLKLVEADRAPSVELSHSKMVLSVRPDTGKLRREQIVEEWLRVQMHDAVPPLVKKWQRVMGVEVRNDLYSTDENQSGEAAIIAPARSA